MSPRALRAGSAALMAAGTLAEWALSHPHPGAAWWHATPGVQALYGLAGCVAIVVVAKWLGQLWLQRPEPDETADE